MTDSADKCPNCGANLDFDEVDIGVGVLRGNPYCPDCQWVPEQLKLVSDACDAIDMFGEDELERYNGGQEEGK